jgi:hypothetical protein
MKKMIQVGALCILTLMAGLVSAQADHHQEAERVFELRTYSVHPGKMPNLLARFRDHTCAIFEKVGMENIGYWVETEPAAGEEPKLHYIIAHKSRAAADASWEMFKVDPDWKAASAASVVDGKIVMKVERVFLTAADFSKIK